jgi:hypothetical protein
MAHCVYGHFLHPLLFVLLKLRFLERHVVLLASFFLDGFNSGLLNAASGIDALFFFYFYFDGYLIVSLQKT